MGLPSKIWTRLLWPKTNPWTAFWLQHSDPSNCYMGSLQVIVVFIIIIIILIWDTCLGTFFWQRGYLNTQKGMLYYKIFKIFNANNIPILKTMAHLQSIQQRVDN